MKAYQHVVIGIDFSPGCLAALSAAVRIASRHGASLTAVHVVDPKLAGVIKDAHHSTDTEVLRHLQESVHAFLATSDARTDLIGVEVCIGHPFLLLHAACKRHQADLLVLGTRGTEHGLNQIGAVAGRCLGKIPADVLLVREGHTGPFKHITACVDFSQTSGKALAAAGALAADENAMLDGLFIYQSALALSMDYGGFMPALPVAIDDTAATWKKELVSFMKPILAGAKTLRWRGKVIEQLGIREGIREHVAETHTDLVVLGTQGKTNLRTLLLGSTAERIVTHSHCSVLTVKPDGFVDPMGDDSDNKTHMTDDRPAHGAGDQPCSCRKEACIRAMSAAIACVSQHEEKAPSPGR